MHSFRGKLLKKRVRSLDLADEITKYEYAGYGSGVSGYMPNNYYYYKHIYNCQTPVLISEKKYIYTIPTAWGPGEVGEYVTTDLAESGSYDGDQTYEANAPGIPHFPTNTLVESYRYKYNTTGQLESIRKENSAASGVQASIKKIIYLHQVPKDLKTEKEQMIFNELQNPYYQSNCSWKGLLWKEASFVEQDGIEKMISAKKYNYGYYNLQNYFGFGYLNKISSASLQIPANNPDLYNFDSFYPEFTTGECNIQGRVVQSFGPDDQETIYIWGYGGLYLVAKIENATMNDVKQIFLIDGPNICNDPLPGAVTKSQADRLYGLPGAFVTLYEYSPHIGLTKVVDSSGKSVNYIYDDHGRLVMTYDDQQNPIESYEYNVKQ